MYEEEACVDRDGFCRELIDDGGGPREGGGALRRPLNAPWMPSSSSHEFAECSVLGVTSSSLPPGYGEPAVAPVTMDEGWTVLRLGDLRGLSSPLALVRCLDGEGRGWRLLPEGDCDEEGGRDFSLALDSRRGSFGGGGVGGGGGGEVPTRTNPFAMLRVGRSPSSVQFDASFALLITLGSPASLTPTPSSSSGGSSPKPNPNGILTATVAVVEPQIDVRASFVQKMLMPQYEIRYLVGEFRSK